MILFWFFCAVMIVIALAFILPTLLQKDADSGEAGREAANIAVYRDQIEELEADLRNGIITHEQFSQDRDEIERRLLEDVVTAGSENGSENDTAKQHEVTTARIKTTTAGANKVRGTSKKKRAGMPAESRAHVYAVAFGIPLIAVVMYLQLGNKAAMEGVANSPVPMAPSSSATQPSSQPANDQERIEANVAKLAKRLQDNPNDLQGWMMLANSYTNMQRFAEAADAYQKAVALKPDDANLLADYAFALAMKNNRHLAGEPAEVLQKALKIDPNNAKALQLSGSAAFEAKDYAKAIEYWEKVLQRAGPDSELGQVISGRIAEAKKLSQSK